MKHVKSKYHFIREQVANETIKLVYCPTSDMIADIFTKPLERAKFLQFRKFLVADIQELSNEDAP